MRLLVTAVATVVALLAAASDASAFCRSTTCTCKSDATCAQDCAKDENGCKTKGNPTFWSGRCIGFSLNLAGTESLSADQWNDAITKAFAAWGAADCGGGQHPSIDTRQLRDSTCAKTEYNSNGPNVSVVYFTDSGWTGGDIEHRLAVTNTHFLSSGEIVDADMSINSAAHDFTVTDTGVKDDLVSVITHEVGHFLGLDHSSDPDALMFWQYDSGSVRRKLSPDDIKAICTVYPPGRDAECDPTPRGGMADGCGDPQQLGCGVAPSRGAADLVSPIAVAIAGLLGLRAISRRRKP
jgi:predicted Zn-dependent protease